MLAAIVIIVTLLIPARNPIRTETSRLHTEGRWIKDASGETIRLVGASVFWRWYFTDETNGYDPLSYIDETVEKYDVYESTGANFLRVQLSKWLWDNANDVYVRAVDTLVDWCTQRSLSVVLTFQGWYDCRPGVYRDYTSKEQVDMIVNGTMEAFVSELAERYKHTKNVMGIEILLDPIPSEAFWASYRNTTPERARSEYRQRLVSAICAIHSVDINYLVFIHPLDADRLRLFVEEDPIREPNVVYCLGRSVSWDKGYWPYADAYYQGKLEAARVLMEEAYRSWLFDVLDLGYAAIMMETEVSSDLQHATTYVDDLMNLFKKYQASICWWAFDREKMMEGSQWLFLLRDTNDRVPTLSEMGVIWAKHTISNRKNPRSDSYQIFTTIVRAAGLVVVVILIYIHARSVVSC